MCPVSVSLDGVEHELRRRCEGMKAEADARLAGTGRSLWFTTGFRDLDEQWRLYRTMLAAVQRYGANWKAHAALAAYPGTSKHGRMRNGKPCADAVDVACVIDLERDIDDGPLRDELAARWGLHQPVPGEAWHVELHPNRGPEPAPSPPVQSPEEDDMPSRYLIVPCPTGGFWQLKREDGGVANREGAPFFGSLPGAGARVVAPLMGLTPCVQNGAVTGYWIFDVDGRVYAFGAAPHYDGYAEHPEWHTTGRVITGLVQSGGRSAGQQIRYKLISEEPGDADWVVDAYDLPA